MAERLTDTFRPNPSFAGQGEAMHQDSDKAPNKVKGKHKGKPTKPALALVADNVLPMAKGQGKGAFGLTAKQEAFCQAIAQGDSGAAAYRKAYSAENMAQHTIHNEACKLLARRDIADRVNAVIGQKKAKSSHDDARIKQHVIENLWQESQDRNNPATVRVRALELMGRIHSVGLFVDKVETTTLEARSPDEISKELKERLAKLAG